MENIYFALGFHGVDTNTSDLARSLSRCTMFPHQKMHDFRSVLSHLCLSYIFLAIVNYFYPCSCKCFVFRLSHFLATLKKAQLSLRMIGRNLNIRFQFERHLFTRNITTLFIHITMNSSFPCAKDLTYQCNSEKSGRGTNHMLC